MIVWGQEILFGPEKVESYEIETLSTPVLCSSVHQSALPGAPVRLLACQYATHCLSVFIEPRER